jgi:hypothetical protein
MLTSPRASEPAEDAELPGFAVIFRLMVPVNEFAPVAVLAASFTAASGLLAAAEEPADPEPEPPEPLHPAMAAVQVTVTASTRPAL